ncbi:MAG: hypothetical protein ACRD3B_01460 [Candidatus Sulfotelmatobacter sp.]
MSLNTVAAYGMYPRNVALPDVVGALNSAGYGKEDICMVLSPAHPDAAAVSDASVLDAGLQDATLSARMIGWFSGFGAVVIPTVGFFVRSQAFLQALFTEQNVPSLSRGSRTLLGLGFSQDDAKRLDHQLVMWARWFMSHAGKTLVRMGQLSFCETPERAKPPACTAGRQQRYPRKIASSRPDSQAISSFTRFPSALIVSIGGHFALSIHRDIANLTAVVGELLQIIQTQLWRGVQHPSCAW